MIEGFSTTIQQDVVSVYNYIKNENNYRDDVKPILMLLPITSILSTVGMAAGITMAFKAVFIKESISLFRLAVGIAIYLISHDFFVIAKNMSSFVKKIKEMDYLQQKFVIGVLGAIPKEMVIQGAVSNTFFHVLWEKAIEKCLNNYEKQLNN